MQKTSHVGVETLKDTSTKAFCGVGEQDTKGNGRRGSKKEGGNQKSAWCNSAAGPRAATKSSCVAPVSGAGLGSAAESLLPREHAAASTALPHQYRLLLIPRRAALLQGKQPHSHSSFSRSAHYVKRSQEALPQGPKQKRPQNGNENGNSRTHHITMYSKLQCSAMKMIAKHRNHRKSNSTDIHTTISLWVFLMGVLDTAIL